MPPPLFPPLPGCASQTSTVPPAPYVAPVLCAQRRPLLQSASVSQSPMPLSQGHEGLQYSQPKACPWWQPPGGGGDALPLQGPVGVLPATGRTWILRQSDHPLPDLP